MKFKKDIDSSNDFKPVGKSYWKGLDELSDTPKFKAWLHREFPQGASEVEGMNRRHFLKIMASSFALAGLGSVFAGCRQQEQYLLPYAKQPEKLVPGVPVYYASSRPTEHEHLPIIAETHDARPTKLEGNPSFKPFGGSSDIYTQASMLDLYCPERLTSSMLDGAAILKADLSGKLKALTAEFEKNQGQGLAFLIRPQASPARTRAITNLQAKLPKALWVEHNPLAKDGTAKALEKATGKRLRPIYNLKNASRILALDSNFLEEGIGKLAYARDFASRRRVNDPSEASSMNRLYSAESDFSITGGQADHRLRVSASHIPAFTAAIAREFAKLSGSKTLSKILGNENSGVEFDKNWVTECALDLWEHRGEALIVPGEHLSEGLHLLVAELNELLGAQGKTLRYVELPKSKAQDFKTLVDALDAGSVDHLFILGGDPVYDAPGNLDWKSLLKKPCVYHLTYQANETTALADIHIAQSHFLESWGDGLTFDGQYLPVQPMIEPIYDSFSELEFLNLLAGSADDNGYQFVRDQFAQLVPGASFETWLAVGVVENKSFYPQQSLRLKLAGLQETIGEAFAVDTEIGPENLDIRFIQSQVFDGSFANNGWMQECPDPMTKLTWGNAICISPRLAKELSDISGINLIPSLSVMNEIGEMQANANNFEIGKERNHVARLKLGDRVIEGPVHIKLGLPDYTIVLPLGYGRKVIGPVGEGIGFSAYPLTDESGQGAAQGGVLEITEAYEYLANTQEHWSMEGRAIIRETCVDRFEEDPDFAKGMGLEAHSPPIYGTHNDDPAHLKATQNVRGSSIYDMPKLGGAQQWGMTVDLNTCIGCNACVVACQSENNIPIVGKEQVLRGREMHWLRIDRYFSRGDADTKELPENPEVSFMGVMCQQCEMAPCEMVCPVNATVHDEEGLNVMAYNRCVGTRYCANNCPYKVRRFNFFDWNKRNIKELYAGPLGEVKVTDVSKMSANPDVTVRMRGVMEKCTYCVQRIEEAKINQRVKAGASDNVLVPEGTIKVACQQVCPTESIVFGDVANPDSEVSKLKNTPRNYSLLGGLNTRPRTTYLAKLRNPNRRMPHCRNFPLSREEYENRYGHDIDHDDYVAGHGAIEGAHH